MIWIIYQSLQSDLITVANLKGGERPRCDEEEEVRAGLQIQL